ncbi:MAG: aspartate aminotransferase family protein [Deltaproteobacteria bacterium]|nr:aspartate aminotransferase family protein [Deltaproteobacteria bacterium]
MTGDWLPVLRTEVPGPASRRRVDVLSVHECPAITARRARRAAALGAADDDPLVWSEAVGANVRDVDGNVYVDLTSGFGVAFVGHRHPRVVEAVRRQSGRLLHAMGDAWPDATRIALLDALARIAPGELEVSILGLSGSDAVEAAVKTAVVATGRTGVVAFEGGYHGLTLGVLPLQGYKEAFTDPFRDIVAADRVRRLPWGCDPQQLADVLVGDKVGLVIAEPILGRGGMIPAPAGWLADIARVAREGGALFALDEVQTGMGRTGALFATEEEGVVPDLMCVGKALAGGLPLSACLGTRAVMDTWGASTGEALHTQTFLGHPLGCAAALAVIGLLQEEDLPCRARERGARLAERLGDRGWDVRGRGLMLGVAFGTRSLAISRTLQSMGYLVLPAGTRGEVLGLTPPVCVTDAQIEGFVEALARAEEETPA